MAKYYELSLEDRKNYMNKKRHKLLHAHLDELLADFITDTGKLTSKTTVTELIEWSYVQTVCPTYRRCCL